MPHESLISPSDTLRRIAAEASKVLTTDVEKAMAGVDTERIEKVAASTPVKFSDLKASAKTEASKRLFAAYMEFSSSHNAYQDLCNSLGVSAALKIEESVTKAQRVISIFHIVQTLSKKLKGEETRAKLCSEAKKVVQDTVPPVPAPLMLMLQEGAAGRFADVDVGGDGGAAEDRAATN